MAEPKAKFSVLIIGCGAIAGGYDSQDISGPNILTHAKAFNIHDGFDLVGCLDIDPEIAQNFVDMWKVDKAYVNLERAMRDHEFDVISICTSTPSHENYLRKLLGYNVRLIFCEKPITDNLYTAREMAGLYKDKMAVNYLRRFDPDIRQVSTDIARGKFGGFISGKSLYNKGLYNNGSHMTDLIQMLIGPLKVVTAANIIHDYWSDDPTISARLEAGENARIEMTGSDVRDGMVFDLELDFEKAKISLLDFSQILTIQYKDGTERKMNTGLNRGMLNAVSNIYDHLTGDSELYSKADNAISALETCSEIRRMAGI